MGAEESKGARAACWLQLEQVVNTQDTWDGSRGTATSACAETYVGLLQGMVLSWQLLFTQK